MQQSNPFFEDIAKMASGAFSSMVEMRHEVEKIAQQQFENFSNKMNFVGRDEFEVVRDLAQKAITENAKLRAEIEALKPAKKTTTSSKSKPKTVKKTTAKKTTSKKPAAK